MMAGGRIDQFHKGAAAQRAVGDRGVLKALTWLCAERGKADGKMPKMKEELLILKRKKKKTPLTGRKCGNLEHMYGVGGTHNSLYRSVGTVRERCLQELDLKEERFSWDHKPQKNTKQQRMRRNGGAGQRS